MKNKNKYKLIISRQVFISNEWEFWLTVPNNSSIAFELLNSMQRNITSMIESNDFRFYKTQKSIFIAHSISLIGFILSLEYKLLYNQISSLELILALFVPVFLFIPIRGIPTLCRIIFADSRTAYSHYPLSPKWDLLYSLSSATESFSSKGSSDIDPTML